MAPDSGAQVGKLPLGNSPTIMIALMTPPIPAARCAEEGESFDGILVHRTPLIAVTTGLVSRTPTGEQSAEKRSTNPSADSTHHRTNQRKHNRRPTNSAQKPSQSTQDGRTKDSTNHPGPNVVPHHSLPSSSFRLSLSLFRFALACRRFFLPTTLIAFAIQAQPFRFSFLTDGREMLLCLLQESTHIPDEHISPHCELRLQGHPGGERELLAFGLSKKADQNPSEVLFLPSGELPLDLGGALPSTQRVA